MENKKTEKGNTNRRNFLKLGLMSSVTAVAGASLISNLAIQDEEVAESGEKMRLLTPDGKIVEVDATNVNKYPEALITPEESRKGIPNRKFVMVPLAEITPNLLHPIEKQYFLLVSPTHLAHIL